jgi:pimeloyl-ACP methyl ester carboxylesterase
VTDSGRSSPRWTPGGLLTILAVVVLALFAFSLGFPFGSAIGILAAAVVLVIGLVGAGIFYQNLAETRDRSCFPPPGRFVEANGLRLHVQVFGNPRVQPVVIFENGELEASPEWAWIAPELARYARVLLYDRPGTGWSPTPAGQVTAQALVDALYQALQDLDLIPPYILAGHGMGGLMSQVFLAAYPQTAAGLVLVDPLPAELAGAVIPPRKRPGLFRRAAVRLGLPRLFGRAWQYAEGLPQQDLEELVAFLNAARSLSTRRIEGSLAGSAAELLALRPPELTNLPMAVLGAAEPDPGLAAPLRAQMTAAQAALAGQSTRSTYRVLPGSDRFTIVHNIDYAQEITTAVRDLVIQTKRASD